MRFFLSVVTRNRQNTDSRTWSILKSSSGCRKLRQRSLSKHAFKLKHRGGRVLDTLRQHSRDT